ncbi:MAG: hypothetical protein IKU69_00660 [Roseburia sp.]|nr:hypothetical protein [Roseburia sp.]
MEKRALYVNVAYLLVLLLIALLSFNVFADKATSVETHQEALSQLEDKKVTALGLTVSVTAVSTAISAIPGDVATPVAEQISELTTPLLIIVCAIYLEKFLLTTIGYLSFKVLIPVACALLALLVFMKSETFMETVFKFAVKLAVFGLAIYFVIPASVKMTNLIEKTFEETITQTYETVEEISEEAEKANEEEKETNAFLEFLSGIGNEATELVESVKNALSVFIDAIAVLIITTCVIPVAVILFFVWLIKMLFGIEIKKPAIPGLF